MIRAIASLVVVAWATVTFSQEPAPVEPQPPPVSDIRSALGRSIESKEVRKLAYAFRGTDPTVHMPAWHKAPDDFKLPDIYTRYQWNTKGIEFEFERAERAGAEWELACVWLFDQGIRGFARYKGALPKGIAFGNTRAQVEKGFGVPSHILMGPAEESWLAGGKMTHTMFKKAGVAVSYLEAKGKEPVVAAVALFTPGEAPYWW